MLENILKLEEYIGNVEEMEPFLQSEVSLRKREFYQRYSGKVREKLENG